MPVLPGGTPGSTSSTLTDNATQRFYIKHGDTGWSIKEQLTILDTNGVAVSFAGATVRFHLLKRATGVLVIDQEASSVANDGTVQYNATSSNNLTAGEYFREWQVTLSGAAGPITVPNDRPGYPVSVVEQLA